MKRIGTTLLWICALTSGTAVCRAATDPDARGVITFDTPTVNGGAINIPNGVSTASNGWSGGGGTVFAVVDGGGYIYKAAVANIDGDPSKWTGSLPNIPNGTYTVWATFTVTNNANPADKQAISSKLVTVAVNNSPDQALAAGGTILFGAGQPTCLTASISGSGTWTVDQNWQKNSVITLYTIPVDGGLQRNLSDLPHEKWTRS